MVKLTTEVTIDWEAVSKFALESKHKFSFMDLPGTHEDHIKVLANVLRRREAEYISTKTEEDFE
jgi:hypothetical protein